MLLVRVGTLVYVVVAGNGTTTENFIRVQKYVTLCVCVCVCVHACVHTRVCVCVLEYMSEHYVDISAVLRRYSICHF